jgi:hypothetical protein
VSAHLAIIRKIEHLGYVVSIHQMKGGIHITDAELSVPDEYIEMHAVKIEDPDEQHIARVDAVGPEGLRQCAVVLARIVGVDNG